MPVVVTSPVTAVISTADSLADGTVGAPSVAFLSDQTTGLYKSAGSTVGIACAGAASLEVSSTAIACHALPLSNVGNITGKTAGTAISAVASVAGITAGAAVSAVATIAGITAGVAISAVASIAGIAAGAAVSALSSLSFIAGGGTVSNCTSVGSTAADLTLKTNSNTQFKLTDTIADGGTAMLVRQRDGATYTLQPVTVGAADSGGTGYRALRVPNAV